jgi:hypothetical protein
MFKESILLRVNETWRNCSGGHKMLEFPVRRSRQMKPGIEKSQIICHDLVSKQKKKEQSDDTDPPWHFKIRAVLFSELFPS